MEKIYSLVCIIFFLLSNGNGFSQSINKNYVKTTDLLESVDISTLNNSYESIKKIESVSYTDGLGNHTQSIAIKQSPSKKDITQHIEYDQFGRSVKKYLPTPTNQGSGEFISNALILTNNYYQSTFSDSHPYSETLYSNSPLNTPQKSSSPGDTWQLINNSNGDHTTKYDYGTNILNEVIKFRVVYENENPFNISQGILPYYPKGELLKNTVKNENWALTDGVLNTKDVFTDKNGRKIVEFSYETDFSGTIKKLSTYYVYDYKGNLRYVLPPKAVNNLFKTVSYGSFNQNFNWSNFVQNPTSIPNASGDVNISLLGYTSTSGTNYEQLRLNFKLLFPFFVLNGGAYLKLGDVVTLPSGVNLSDQYLFSIYNTGKKGNLIPVLDPIVGTAGNLSKSRYEYHIINNKLFVYFKIGTDFGSPQVPFKVYKVDRYFAKNFPTIIFNTEILENLCFQYRYDQFNRQIEQKVPGKGWEYMVYDQLDRPILTQDAILKTENKWLFTKYDVHGRSIYSGLYLNSSDRETLQQQLDNYILAGNNQSNIDQKIALPQTVGSIAINYSNTAFPNTNIEVLTVSYYDDYLFSDPYLTSIPTHIIGQSVTNRTKGLLTAVWTKTIGSSSTWIKDYSFYDNKGRIIYVKNKNYVGGTTEIKSKLDFRGKLEKSVTTHKRLSTDSDLTITDRFKYDHIERPTRHYQQINNQQEELISKNNYNELGQLISKNIGGQSTTNTSTQFNNSNGLLITGNVIEKTAGYGWGNAGFETKSIITNDGYIEYEITQNNKRLMIGLSTNSSNDHYNSINYAIYTGYGGLNRVYVYENGVGQSFPATYFQIGDIMKVERIGTTIYYKKNGVLFKTTTGVNIVPLRGDSSFLDPGPQIKNLYISSDYTDIAGLNVRKLTSGAVQIKKETGVSSWSSGLATTNVIQNNGKLTYSVGQNNKYIMVGLSNSNVNANYNSIQYAIYTRANGNIHIYESGVNKGLMTTYVANDFFEIQRINGTIHYKKNGTTFYTSLTPSSGSLLGDTSFYNIGGVIYNLEIQNNESGLQTIDYAYNIRGWLTNFNDIDNLGTDLFAYKMNYQAGSNGLLGVTPQYNGNISQTIWKSATDNTNKSYSYTYDKLSRYKTAGYGEGSALVNNPNKFGAFVTGYDSNGNITGVIRNGVGSGGATINIDNLAYHYDAGNKLLSIDDNTSNNTGFIDGNTTGNDYEYDSNANLIKDSNKNIDAIEYNYIDLVTKVVFSNGDIIDFTYDAAGNKLKMITTHGATVITTEYFGGFQYRNSQLLYFPTPEGYAQNNNTAGYSYTYVLKDHLGNNRLSFSDADLNGIVTTVEILSHTNYYPMGLTHSGAVVAGSASNYNYYFQGKEQLAFGGYEMYDFGSRMYDTSVGRWFNSDPQNQFVSPYVAMGNNYIMMTDPNGEWIHIAIGAVIGGVINVAMNWDNIDSFGEGLASFGVGAVVGGATAACGTCGGAAAIAIGGGALMGATNNVIGQTGNGVGVGDVDWNSTIQSGFIGGVSGGAGSVAGQYANKVFGAVIINGLKVTSPVLQGTINGAVGGAVGGGTAGYLTTGSLDGAIDGAAQGFKTGAAIGATAGFGSAYIDAKSHNTNPWNGKALSIEKVSITKSGILKIKSHLSKSEFDYDMANDVMINRLENIANGKTTATSIDLNFYTHEIRELYLMKFQKMNYKSAHEKSLFDYGIDYKKGFQYKIYTNDAIKTGNGYERWRNGLDF